MSGWAMSGWADERWGGERICNPSTLSWWTSANYDISRLSKEFFALWLGGEFSRCRRHSVMFSYHPATNLMFSGLNPPDREPKTSQRFFAQNPIFRCVKNFMHLISFLFIPNYLYLSLIIRAPKKCRIFAMLTRNGTIIVEYKRLLR